MISLNKKIAILFLALILLIIPLVFVSAQTSRIVPCDGADCNFNSFIQLINNIINWIISIAGVIFTISLIYGGFLYMTGGDKPANKEKAKTLLWSTLKGFVIILVSWLIVYTIIKTLVPDGAQQNIILRYIRN